MGSRPGRTPVRKEGVYDGSLLGCVCTLAAQRSGTRGASLGHPVSKALSIFAQAPLSLVAKTVPSELVLKMEWRCLCSVEVGQVLWGVKLILEGILFGKTRIYTFPVQNLGVPASLVALASCDVGSSGLRLTLGTVTAESQGPHCQHGSEVLPGCGSTRTTDSGVWQPQGPGYALFCFWGSFSLSLRLILTPPLPRMVPTWASPRPHSSSSPSPSTHVVPSGRVSSRGFEREKADGTIDFILGDLIPLGSSTSVSHSTGVPSCWNTGQNEEVKSEMGLSRQRSLLEPKEERPVPPRAGSMVSSCLPFPLPVRSLCSLSIPSLSPDRGRQQGTEPGRGRSQVWFRAQARGPLVRCWPRGQRTEDQGKS